MFKVAVIQFPGLNCEYETLRALKFAGLDARIVRWNLGSHLRDFHAFVIPGGFSFQDRIRAGVIASRSPLVGDLSSLAKEGKPILGICNGAQILVEAGLVPGWDEKEAVLGLAPNISGERSGYYSSWVYLKVRRDEASPFTSGFSDDETLPIPVAHAEGRFVAITRGVEEELTRNGQIAFRYATAAGLCENSFPTNPNGSFLNAAGVTNREGNVLALMPHPERAFKLRCLPEVLEGDWGELRRKAWGNFDLMDGPGPGTKIFLSMKKYLTRTGAN